LEVNGTTVRPRIRQRTSICAAKNFDKAKEHRLSPARVSCSSPAINLLEAAQDRKGIRFWNLILYMRSVLLASIAFVRRLVRGAITTFQMSPAGKDSWGPDQCKNDRDGTVDHNERLRITGIEPGRYDVKLADKIGRVCIVRDIEVKDGAVFSIEERQLTDCGR
jgi:hypothetical protein